MNFLEDLVELKEVELVGQGYNIPPTLKSDLVVFLARCFENAERKIPQGKRKVHLSQALLNSSDYTNYKDAIGNIKSISETGGDLTPYQSKSIDKFEYSEFLLFDWGIQHLHLGAHSAGSKFSVRSGPLLFTYLTNSEAYFIAVLDHGKWAELDILDIIDQEWNHLIAPFILSNVLDIKPVLTAQQTLKLRKAGINVLQKLSSGKVVCSPGGGLTTAKTSASAMNQAQKIAHLMDHIEQLVQKDRVSILASLGGVSTDRIRLDGLSIFTKKVTLTIEGTAQVYSLNY